MATRRILLSPGGTSAFFAFVTFFGIAYYNLTPFIGVDCWWHMRFAEYFLQNGTPVVYDPFAVQAEKILATYPDILPGTIFLLVFKYWSYLGLNILRISIFLSFILALLLLVRHRWSDYAVLVQIGLLAIAMAGRVILQPDIFNYILFFGWIYFLHRITDHDNTSKYYFIMLIVIEMAWVNTHVLFFYYGLFVADVYLLISIILSWKDTSPKIENIKLLAIYFAILNVIWLANPLGWRALQSLFINMLDPDFPTLSTETFNQSLDYVNSYVYVLIPALFVLLRPWRRWRSRWILLLDFAMFMTLLIPSLKYERCWPFFCIYLIMLQGKTTDWEYTLPPIGRHIFMLLVVVISIFLVLDRSYPISLSLSKAIELKRVGSGFPGIGVGFIATAEPIREVNIINQIAGPGNCLTNELTISSCAVWHCKDKPFFMHGHAAVINARHRELREFLQDITSKEAKDMIYKYDIRTIVLTNSNETCLTFYPTLREFLQLVYMDPYMAILVRKDTITPEQRDRIKQFYATFRPGLMDAIRFNYPDKVLQLVLLWFSAEMTGNDGEQFLAVAKKVAPEENVERLQKKLRELLPSKSTSLLDHPPPINPLPEAD